MKIYATDIDEDALAQARLAIYSAKEIESVPAELRERYFERADQRLAFRKDLRRTVIFGRNDLVQDAPISRLDLLICRNTLMYFTAETQARILRHFHFALRDDGVLLLGKSEMMISHCDLFAPADLKKRVFVKQPRATLAARAGAFAVGRAGDGDGDDDRASRDAALELGPHAAPDRLELRPADASPTCPRARCFRSRARTSASPLADLGSPPSRWTCARRSSRRARPPAGVRRRGDVRARARRRAAPRRQRHAAAERG